jgi:hypothetical protein
MEMKSMSSGGNWLTWPFQIVGTQDLAELGSERAKRRKEGSKRGD